MLEQLRNIAIIAHVDHGKTTLIDQLLRQSGALQRRDEQAVRLMDSNDQEKERGITILAKNTAIDWNGYRINIIDTPGHNDFGGEVERVLSMVESVLLLVDAAEGPMPQTRFVTAKAFAHQLNPIVVINKIDRHDARPEWVVNQVFELFDNLGANEAQLDFPVIYASATNGVAGHDAHQLADSMQPLFETICQQVAPPKVDAQGPLQMQISALDYSKYVGIIGIGRIHRGRMEKNQSVVVVDKEGNSRNGKIAQILRYHGLSRQPAEAADAGDIISIAGIENLKISDTLCHPSQPQARPPLTVDEPTLSVVFQVNDSPFAGRDGKYITSRHLHSRLHKEQLHNIALYVEAAASTEQFKVSGRGELHLSVLIETMRREGYELGISRPQVVEKEIDGKRCEPYEMVVFDIEETHQGAVIQEISQRQGALKNILPAGSGRIRLEFIVPTRGLIGLRGIFLTLTSGSGTMTSAFDHYDDVKPQALNRRKNGVLISMGRGKTTAYALHNLQNRGQLLLGAGADIYEGQIIGVHARDNDLTVNPIKGKQLTNFRAAGSDEALTLTPPLNYSLEQALAFIDDDELIEVTPRHIRLRKKFLSENARKSGGRKG